MLVTRLVRGGEGYGSPRDFVKSVGEGVVVLEG